MFERLPESIRHGGQLIESKKRRQGSSPQSASRPNAFKHDEFMQPRRASTFPESMPNSKRTAHGHALPISSLHLTNLGLEPAYGSPSSSSSSFFETMPNLTPTSSTASLAGFGVAPPMHNVQHSSSFPPTPLAGSFPDPVGLNVPLSDISTMMFPSADPLAYPNPPMTTFENRHPQIFDRNTSSPVVGVPHQMAGVDMKSQPAMFGAPGMPSGPGRRANDNEVQLFGPMPMYLMQGAQSYRGFPPQAGSPHMPMPGSNIPFDDLLNHDEWTQNLMDPGMDLNNTRSPLGSNQHYGQPGSGLGGWH